MTIAVDLGRKATKQNKNKKKLYKRAESLSMCAMCSMSDTETFREFILIKYILNLYINKSTSQCRTVNFEFLIDNPSSYGLQCSNLILATYMYFHSCRLFCDSVPTSAISRPVVSD